MSTPTQKTLAYLRERGFLAEVVEKWNPYARVRQDLFGFTDIVAVRGDSTLFVQCTSAANVPARRRKIADSESASKVASGTRRIIVMGWKKGDTRSPRVEVYPFTEGALQHHID